MEKGLREERAPKKAELQKALLANPNLSKDSKSPEDQGFSQDQVKTLVLFKAQ